MNEYERARTALTGDPMMAGRPTRRLRPPWSSWIRTAREAAGLTQTAMAESMGVAVSTIGRWETGEAAPSAATLAAIASATGYRDPVPVIEAANCRRSQKQSRIVLTPLGAAAEVDRGE